MGLIASKRDCVTLCGGFDFGDGIVGCGRCQKPSLPFLPEIPGRNGKFGKRDLN